MRHVQATNRQWLTTLCLYVPCRPLHANTASPSPLVAQLFCAGGFQSLESRTVMSNTHRRRRRDETVELRRVGGVSIPVGSRDPVYNFLCLQLTSDDIMTSMLKKL